MEAARDRGGGSGSARHTKGERVMLALQPHHVQSNTAVRLKCALQQPTLPLPQCAVNDFLHPCPLSCPAEVRPASARQYSGSQAKPPLTARPAAAAQWLPGPPACECEFASS